MKWIQLKLATISMQIAWGRLLSVSHPRVWVLTQILKSQRPCQDDRPLRHPFSPQGHYVKGIPYLNDLQIPR